MRLQDRDVSWLREFEGRGEVGRHSGTAWAARFGGGGGDLHPAFGGRHGSRQGTEQERELDREEKQGQKGTRLAERIRSEGDQARRGSQGTRTG